MNSRKTDIKVCRRTLSTSLNTSSLQSSCFNNRLLKNSLNMEPQNNKSSTAWIILSMVSAEALDSYPITCINFISPALGLPLFIPVDIFSSHFLFQQCPPPLFFVFTFLSLNCSAFYKSIHSIPRLCASLHQGEDRAGILETYWFKKACFHRQRLTLPDAVCL